MMPTQDVLIQSITNGASLGCLIGLLAVGYSQVYGIARIINFAHGEIFTFAGYYIFSFMTDAPRVHRHFLVAWLALVTGAALASLLRSYGWKRQLGGSMGGAIFGFAIAGATVGQGLSSAVAVGLSVLFAVLTAVACEYIVYTPVLRRPRLFQIVAAVGLSFWLQGTMQFLFSSERRRLPQSTLASKLISTHLNALDAAILVLTISVTAALWWISLYTSIGVEARALADDPVVAARLGVSPHLSRIRAFAFGGGLAALCAFLFVTRQHVLEPTIGFNQGLLAFCAAVLGGIGSMFGALIGGLVIGVILSILPLFSIPSPCPLLPESLCKLLPSLELSDWGLGVVYFAITFVLITRPRGIIAERSWREA